MPVISVYDSYTYDIPLITVVRSRFAIYYRTRGTWLRYTNLSGTDLILLLCHDVSRRI